MENISHRNCIPSFFYLDRYLPSFFKIIFIRRLSLGSSSYYYNSNHYVNIIQLSFKVSDHRPIIYLQIGKDFN